MYVPTQRQQNRDLLPPVVGPSRVVLVLLQGVGAGLLRSQRAPGAAGGAAGAVPGVAAPAGAPLHLCAAYGATAAARGSGGRSCAARRTAGGWSGGVAGTRRPAPGWSSPSPASRTSRGPEPSS